MNYLEFIKNEESQVVEAIVFREDAVELFYDKMEESNYFDRLVLIHSLYDEVIVRIFKEGILTPVKCSGTEYEMHIHMFTTYLVSMFYNSQYWEILLNVLDFYSRDVLDYQDCLTVAFYNLFRKLTFEPIEKFVNEVQIVCPGYTLDE